MKGPVRKPRKPKAQVKQKAQAKSKATRSAKPVDALKAFDEKIKKLSALYAKGKAKGDDGKDVRFHVESVPLTGEVSSRVKQKVSTGSIELDRLLDGGIPTGRLTELYGPEHVGKSTILDGIFAQVQKVDGIGVLADAEQARDEIYTASLGVDVDALRVLEFPKGEMSAEAICNVLLDSTDWWFAEFPVLPVVLGWDALGGTATIEELGKKVGDRVVASAAKVMRELGRRLPNHISGTNVAIIICNHEYETISRGGRPGWTETYGGKGVRHAATLRIKLFPSKAITTSDGRYLGREVKATLHKNRLGASGEVCLAMLDKSGVSNTYSLYQSFLGRGVIAINGSWSVMNLDGQELKFQGWLGLERKIQEIDDLWPRLVSVYQEVMRAPVSV